MAYTIKVGNTGIDVKKMQYYLNQILKQPNLKPMVEDGVYGQVTEFAVAVFQYVYTLPVDGVIGTSTWDHIVTEFKSLPNPTPETNKTSRTLSVGNVGLAVQKFQVYLNTLVSPTPLLVTDGNFGQKTKQAVQKFQALQGLTMDGVIGNNTWDRIIQLI